MKPYPIDAEQPHDAEFPMWDEPLSKVTAPFDIERARQRLAERFNRRKEP